MLEFFSVLTLAALFVVLFFPSLLWMLFLCIVAVLISYEVEKRD